MGTVAFSWEGSKKQLLLLVHNRDDSQRRKTLVKPACWDENRQVFGARDEETGGYSLSFSKDGRIAFLVHPNPLLRTPGIERLASDFTSSKDPILPKDYAERCEQRETDGNNFYLIVADITTRSMYFIEQTTDTSLKYHEVAHGVYILSDCGLDSSRPKSEALKVSFENMLIKYGNEEPCGKTIAETIMLDTTRADDGEFLSSVFVDYDGYGTLSTTSISVSNYDPNVNSWNLKFFESYMAEDEQWLKQDHCFQIVDAYKPTWQRTSDEEAGKEAATEAADSPASDGE